MTDLVGENRRPRSECSEIDRDLKAFTGLLDLAEEIYARREDIRRNAFWAAGSSMAVILAAGVSMVLLAEYPVPGVFGNSLLLIIFASVILVACLGGASTYRCAVKQLSREENAFEKAISVVHEVLETFKINMSPLEVSRVQIRLSRMDN